MPPPRHIHAPPLLLLLAIITTTTAQLTLYFDTPLASASGSVDAQARAGVAPDATVHVGGGVAASVATALRNPLLAALGTAAGTEEAGRPQATTAAYVATPLSIASTLRPTVGFHFGEARGAAGSGTTGGYLVGEFAYNPIANQLGGSVAQGSSGTGNALTYGAARSNYGGDGSALPLIRGNEPSNDENDGYGPAGGGAWGVPMCLALFDWGTLDDFVAFVDERGNRRRGGDDGQGRSSSSSEHHDGGGNDQNDDNNQNNDQAPFEDYVDHPGGAGKGEDRNSVGSGNSNNPNNNKRRDERAALRAVAAGGGANKATSTTPPTTPSPTSVQSLADAFQKGGPAAVDAFLQTTPLGKEMLRRAEANNARRQEAYDSGNRTSLRTTFGRAAAELLPAASDAAKAATGLRNVAARNATNLAVQALVGLSESAEPALALQQRARAALVDPVRAASARLASSGLRRAAAGLERQQQRAGGAGGGSGGGMGQALGDAAAALRASAALAAADAADAMVASVPSTTTGMDPAEHHDHEAVELSFVDLEYEDGDGGSVGFRLIYPCDGVGGGGGGGANAAAAPKTKNKPDLIAPRWGDALPQYAHGYASVAFFGGTSLKYRALKWGLTALLWVVSAAWAVPLLRGRPLVAAPQEDDDANDDDQNQQHQRLPVVVFSHGACANRHTYTFLAREIARRVPCAVACVEHADGSAAAARLPATAGNGGNEGGEKWMYFRGLGKGDALESKCGVRVDEVRLTVRALEALDRGGAAATGSGGRVWRLGGGASSATKNDPVLSSFVGRLDLAERLAVAGHSCGGATAAAAAVEGGVPSVSAAVAIDPWWPLLRTGRPPLVAAEAEAEAEAVPSSSAPSAPLLVLGSHAWQTPRLPDGGMMCDADRQRRVLDAWTGKAAGAAKGKKKDDNNPAPPGALLVVPRGSGHHSFSDVALLIEGSRFLRYLRTLMGASHPELASAEAIEMSGWAVARFLRDRWRFGGKGGGSGGGDAKKRAPRPVSPAELDAYREFFGERAAVLEAHV